MMLNRRSILKLLGCAPCAPLAPKVHEYFDDWRDGVLNSVRPHSWVSNLYVIDITVTGKDVTLPSRDVCALYVSGDGFGAHHTIENFSLRHYLGEVVFQAEVVSSQYLGLAKFRGKHVHFKVEAD